MAGMWRAVFVCGEGRIIPGRVRKLATKGVVVDCVQNPPQDTGCELVIEFPPQRKGQEQRYLRARCKVIATVLSNGGFKVEASLLKLLDEGSTELLKEYVLAEEH